MDKESLKRIEGFVNQRIDTVKEQHKKELATLSKRFDSENKKLQRLNAMNTQKVRRLENIVAQHSREIQHLEQKVSEANNKLRTWGGK